MNIKKQEHKLHTTILMLGFTKHCISITMEIPPPSSLYKNRKPKGNMDEGRRMPASRMQNSDFTK
jgi:hypothetical protein